MIETKFSKRCLTREEAEIEIEIDNTFSIGDIVGEIYEGMNDASIKVLNKCGYSIDWMSEHKYRVLLIRSLLSNGCALVYDFIDQVTCERICKVKKIFDRSIVIEYPDGSEEILNGKK